MFDSQRAIEMILRLGFCGLGSGVGVGTVGPFCVVGIVFLI
jgi:hypothetical protein